MHSIIFHAHQKLDRVAHRHLKEVLPAGNFPSLKEILYFEAGHGPDGAKLKRQQQGGEQPWHFIDPHDATDQRLHELIQLHYDGLKNALAKDDSVRSAFEAAWLAHALVDGLTPAHHYPYEQELEKLRGGADRNTRKGLMGRLYVGADSFNLSFQRSLKLIGPKGLLTSHAMFEVGAFTLIAPLKLSKARPSKSDLNQVLEVGVLGIFKQLVKEIADMDIYDRFQYRGWTQVISQDVRRELAPRMVRMITLAWYAAAKEAGAKT
jgi:hypothetical protein